MMKWLGELENLTEIACTHPHASYVYGVIGKWLSVRTIDIGSSIFQPLEDAIHNQFIPAQMSSSPEVRKLLSLPTRLGGLNIINPVDIPDGHLKASIAITTPLKKTIIEQSDQPQLQVVLSALHRERCQPNATMSE